jgi:hypothetical protein
MTNIILIEKNLLLVLDEISKQPEVGESFPPELQSFAEQVTQIREYIKDAGEYGIAYESLVAMLDSFHFQLSGHTAIRLLEVGLLMRFKTELPLDAKFDSRLKEK